MSTEPDRSPWMALTPYGTLRAFTVIGPPSTDFAKRFELMGLTFNRTDRDTLLRMASPRLRRVMRARWRLTDRCRSVVEEEAETEEARADALNASGPAPDDSEEVPF